MDATKDETIELLKRKCERYHREVERKDARIAELEGQHRTQKSNLVFGDKLIAKLKMTLKRIIHMCVQFEEPEEERFCGECSFVDCPCKCACEALDMAKETPQ